jgi:hypothetical protein
MSEWQSGTTTFHEARSIQGKAVLPNKDFIMLNQIPVFVDQINEFVQAQMEKVTNPPPPPPPPQFLPAPVSGHTTVTEVPPATPDPGGDDDKDTEVDDSKTLARVPRGLSPYALPRYVREQHTKALDLSTTEEKQAYATSMEATRKRFEAAYEKKIADYFDQERKAVVSAIKASSASRADKKIESTINYQSDDLKDVLMSLYKDVSVDVGAQTQTSLGVGTKGVVQDFIKMFGDSQLKYLLLLAGTKIKQITTTTLASIRLELTDGVAQGESIPDLAKRVDLLYLDQIIPNRSTTIVRTEVVASSNYASVQSAQSSGLTLTKVWLATDDNRTRPDHADADGQEVAMDAQFEVGDEKLGYPGDSSGSPENVINCRCTVYYKRVASDDTEDGDDNEDDSKSLKTYVLSLPEATISRDRYRQFLKAHKEDKS